MKTNILKALALTGFALLPTCLLNSCKESKEETQAANSNPDTIPAYEVGLQDIHQSFYIARLISDFLNDQDEPKNELADFAILQQELNSFQNNDYSLPLINDIKAFNNMMDEIIASSTQLENLPEEEFEKMRKAYRAKFDSIAISRMLHKTLRNMNLTIHSRSMSLMDKEDPTSEDLLNAAKRLMQIAKIQSQWLKNEKMRDFLRTYFKEASKVIQNPRRKIPSNDEEAREINEKSAEEYNEVSAAMLAHTSTLPSEMREAFESIFNKTKDKQLQTPQDILKLSDKELAAIFLIDDFYRCWEGNAPE